MSTKPTMRTALAEQAASSERLALIELAAKDLNPQGGVFCPSPKAHMQLWNTHPKVYLDVGKTGAAKCPYCGTIYKLRAGEHFGGGH